MTEERRRPGRPPNPEPSDETAHIDVRLTPAERRAIRIAAAQADVSMNAWIRQAAREKLERENALRE